MCKKILVQYHNSRKEIKTLGYEYFFSTENQVYNFYKTRFYLFYDFSSHIGDTVELYVKTNSNLYCQLSWDAFPSDLDTLPKRHLVKETDSIKINEKNYYSIFLKYIPEAGYYGVYPAFLNDYIIKGIGCTSFLMGDFLPILPEFDHFGPLRCYSDSSITYSVSQPCDTLISSIKNDLYQKSKAIVFPNPVTAETVLSFSNPEQKEVSIVITDINGKKIESAITRDNSFKLDFNKYIEGLYVYKVYSNSEFIGSGKFIKNTR